MYWRDIAPYLFGSVLGSIHGFLSPVIWQGVILLFYGSQGDRGDTYFELYLLLACICGTIMGLIFGSFLRNSSFPLQDFKLRWRLFGSSMLTGAITYFCTVFLFLQTNFLFESAWFVGFLIALALLPGVREIGIYFFSVRIARQLTNNSFLAQKHELISILWAGFAITLIGIGANVPIFMQANHFALRLSQQLNAQPTSCINPPTLRMPLVRCFNLLPSKREFTPGLIGGEQRATITAVTQGIKAVIPSNYKIVTEQPENKSWVWYYDIGHRLRVKIVLLEENHLEVLTVP